MVFKQVTKFYEKGGCSDNERLLASFIPDSKPNKRSHERTARSGTEDFIPHNILSSSRLDALATRIKMAPAQQSAFTEAFVEEARGLYLIFTAC
ncbi:hypothetical protein SNE40_009663 [Patella caerulea]|uniref:Uncharacterized protein n=1 Tax=Patella caerulea TaxID=87958 RepID=A0AAN8JT14_PATCE